MKITIISLVFVLIVLGCSKKERATAPIRVFTTAKTNAEIAVINTTDVFTRDGQTNLVRFTTTMRGLVTARHHRFYHAGVLVGDYWARQDSSGFIIKGGSPYSVIFKYSPSKEVSSVFICTNDLVVIDCFIATNEVFNPADSSTIREANKRGEDVTMHLPQSKK
jgi:hypothetical protein